MTLHLDCVRATLINIHDEFWSTTLDCRTSILKPPLRDVHHVFVEAFEVEQFPVGDEGPVGVMKPGYDTKDKARLFTQSNTVT